MSTFSEQVLSCLQSFTSAVTVDRKGIFEMFKDTDRQLIIQAVDVDIFNSIALPNDYFSQQIEQHASHGERIVHCWEDLWNNKTPIINSRLQSLLGNSRAIHGRQCRIKRVPADLMSSFLQANHLLGNARGKYNLGLYHGDDLVAVALFARSVPVQRNGHTYHSHEMIRFCSLRGHYVQGGLSKLLKAFIDREKPDDIYTVVDRDWSDGEAFIKLGFKQTGISSPLTFWLDANGDRTRKKPFEEAKQVTNAGNRQLLLSLK